jgi:hypothetical protein
MSVKIENIIERIDYVAPNKRVIMLEVHYVTDKQYRGVVDVEKQGATKASISAAVAEAAALPDDLIGSKVGK